MHEGDWYGADPSGADAHRDVIGLSREFPPPVSANSG